MGFRMGTKRVLAGVAVGCLLAAAITAAAGSAKKDIVISLEKKEIREMDGSGLILVFYLQIANSERSAYSLVEYDYRVVVQDIDYFALRTALEEPIPVAGESTTRISLPLKITYADLLERVPSAADGPKALCYAIGQMIFADSRDRREKIPFAFSGEFPIYRPLEVEIRPLEVKTLTIGGAEFAVVFSCRNNNDFEMVLGKLTYRLDLEGRTVAAGVVPPGKRIESRGEIVFSMPHMLEFFEVGREVFETMQKPSAAGELSIASRAESIWGEIEVNSTQKGDVQILRAQ
jgi:LEA14-like dessication related protein